MLGTLGISIFNGKVYVDGAQYKHLYILWFHILYCKNVISYNFTGHYLILN